MFKVLEEQQPRSHLATLSVFAIAVLNLLDIC